MLLKARTVGGIIGIGETVGIEGMTGVHQGGGVMITGVDRAVHPEIGITITAMELGGVIVVRLVGVMMTTNIVAGVVVPAAPSIDTEAGVILQEVGIGGVMMTIAEVIGIIAMLGAMPEGMRDVVAVTTGTTGTIAATSKGINDWISFSYLVQI